MSGRELMEAGERLLVAIAARDYEAVAGCFAEDATFRALTSGPLREHEGPAQAAERYRFWLEPLEGFEVLESDAVAIAGRVRVRYRFRGRDPKKGWQLNEHTAYAAVRGGRIESMILTCSGFRPTTPPG